MYNVQMIPTHNKQTHFQLKFPKTNYMDDKKIHRQTKIEKKNISPFKSSLKT